MPFELNGFLGRESEQFVEKHKAEFGSVFDLARKTNCLAHSILAKVRVQTGESYENVAVALYLRVLNSYAATFRLMEFGLGVDAGTVLRSCVESTVFLKKIAVDPKWAKSYVRASGEKRLRFIKEIQADKSGKLNFMNSDPIKVQRERERLEAAGFGIGQTEYKVSKIAALVGLEDLYNSAYRHLSNHSTHSSATSLQSHLDIDENGKTIGLKHMAITEDYRLMFVIASTSIIVSMAALLEIFEPDPLKEHVQEQLRAIDAVRLSCEREAQGRAT